MKVLRWILFLPGAVAASLLAAFLAYSAADLASNTLAQISAAFFSTLVFVAVAGVIAPAGRNVVTITLSAIITFTAIVAFLLSELTALEPYANMSPALKVLIPVSQVLACAVAIFGVQRFQRIDSQTALSLFGCLVGMAMMVSAIAVYVVSVYQAYDSGGKWGFVAIPLLGQMFWFIVRLKFFGFFNSYTYVCVAFLVSGTCFQLLNDTWLANRRSGGV